MRIRRKIYLILDAVTGRQTLRAGFWHASALWGILIPLLRTRDTLQTLSNGNVFSKLLDYLISHVDFPYELKVLGTIAVFGPQACLRCSNIILFVVMALSGPYRLHIFASHSEAEDL